MYSDDWGKRVSSTSTVALLHQIETSEERTSEIIRGDS
jgi:hypothetical protein